MLFGFQQFLGPNRNGTVEGLRLARDWDARPPREVWRREVGAGWSSFAVAGGIAVTQEQRGPDEMVVAYDLSTGEILWTHSDPERYDTTIAGIGPRATPTVVDGRVYTLGATGVLNALDAGDGSVIWSRDVAVDAGMEVPVWGFSSSPLVVEDLLVVAAGGKLLGYGLAGGDLRWAGPDGGPSYSSPHRLTIDGIAQILMLNNAGATSVAPVDGRLLWEHAWAGASLVQPALTADGDLLISAGEGKGVRRIGAAHGPGGWTVEERQTHRKCILDHAGEACPRPPLAP